MGFGSFDGGDNGEYSDVSFVEISWIFASQGAFVFVTKPYDVE